MYRHAISLMAAAGLFAGSANAAPHNVNPITTPVLVSNGYTGQFDVRSFLGPNRSITQASILFSFIDDIETFRINPLPGGTSHVRTGVEYVQQTQYGAASYPTRYVEMLQSRRQQVIDISAETATVSIAGEARSGGTASNANNQYVYTDASRRWDRTSCLQTVLIGAGSACALAEIYFTDIISDYYGKLGSFDIRFDPLGSQALADLNADGLLDFHIGFNGGGDARLTAAQLNFDLIVTGGGPSGHVAEPSLLALLGVGLLALLQRRRQRR